MTRRLGRFVRHNTIALLALFLVLGGTSFAAGTLINGSQIKKHSIAKNRLTNLAVKQLKGNRGPRGLQGPMGAKGTTGAQGLQGPKGDPGNTNTFTYKRTANAGDNITIASFGPFTLKGDCTGTTANPTAQWTISTSADHSAFTDYDNSYLSDFSASDGPKPIEY